MGTKYDPNHPHCPRGPLDSLADAYRLHGDEAPWLLAWKGSEVMINLTTGRYINDHELRADGGVRGRDGRRH